MNKYMYRNRRFKTPSGTTRSLPDRFWNLIISFFTVVVANDLRKENGLIRTTAQKLLSKRDTGNKHRVITPEYKVYDVKDKEKI
ncbi:MAG: hypothetical protein JXR56_00860 [Candidatus Cloacimonetes bacterium]|nr:hypothetical protein [Candidatus Cloacimonadota bacterium]